MYSDETDFGLLAEPTVRRSTRHRRQPSRYEPEVSEAVLRQWEREEARRARVAKNIAAGEVICECGEDEPNPECIMCNGEADDVADDMYESDEDESEESEYEEDEEDEEEYEEDEEDEEDEEEEVDDQEEVVDVDVCEEPAQEKPAAVESPAEEK